MGRFSVSTHRNISNLDLNVGADVDEINGDDAEEVAADASKSKFNEIVRAYGLQETAFDMRSYREHIRGTQLFHFRHLYLAFSSNMGVYSLLRLLCRYQEQDA